MSRSEYVIRLPEIPAQTDGGGERGDILCTAEGVFDVTYWSALLAGDFGRIICYVTGDWATGEVVWSYSGHESVLIEGDNLHLVANYNGNTVVVTATVGEKSSTQTLEFPPF